MPYKQRIETLTKLHKNINEEIDKLEKNHPHSNVQQLHDMKKTRLQYKDELLRLTKMQWEEDHERVGFLDDDR